MYTTKVDEEVEVTPFMKTFVIAVQDVFIFCTILSLILVLTLYITNLTNLLENLKWSDLLFQLIFDTATESETLNAGSVTVSCIYGGPTSCVGPTVVLPSYYEIQPNY